MTKKLKDIAEILKGELVGDGSIEISGLAGIEQAQAGDLAFLANPKYKKFLETTKASAVIVPWEITAAKVPLIRHQNSYLAFCKALEIFVKPKKDYAPEIHPTALIGKGVKLGKDIFLGPYVVIEDKVVLGDNVVVLAGSFIGEETVIGEESFIYPNVTIREKISIGKNAIIHPGVVIGSDGFGYAWEGGKYRKIPQAGIVVIEDDVEIGANACIDRATMGETRIKKGAKIDNLVQIAHNVDIGENSAIAGQVGIAGSSKIGKNVILGGQVGVLGHLQIGDNARLGAQAAATKSLKENQTYSGYPAREHRKAKRIEACISNLPELFKRVKELENLLKKENK
jgi:UDP-3-O-[3-hydroxymyristoyl] glucosamine N-acyltransferase